MTRWALVGVLAAALVLGAWSFQAPLAWGLAVYHYNLGG